MISTHQDAFAQRFLKDQGRIYAYIAVLLPHRSDAEDVFQQTSLILWQKWQEYDRERDFVTWACGIAHNTVRNFLRASRRSRVSFTDSTLELLSEMKLASDASEDRILAMRQCLASLPAEQETFVRDCYSGAAPVSEIARQMAVSPTALYMKLHRLRQTLLTCIERRLAEEQTP